MDIKLVCATSTDVHKTLPWKECSHFITLDFTAPVQQDKKIYQMIQASLQTTENAVSAFPSQLSQQNK